MNIPNVPRLSGGTLAALFCSLAIVSGEFTAQVAYVDSQGREWREMNGLTNRSWNQIAAVFPTDAATPASGLLSGVNVTGLIWASTAQVTEMFAEFVPEISATGSVQGANYVLPALGFFGSFNPTFEYYTTFGGYNFISGWTSSLMGGQGGLADASAQYPVFFGSFGVSAVADPASTNAYRGIWVFRPPVSPFASVGGGLPGSLGPAVLSGSGTLVAGSPTTLKVRYGVPTASAYLVVGLEAANQPVLGGILVPRPDLVLAGLTLDAQGALDWITPWPAGLLSGQELFLQVIFVDAVAANGLAATNGVRVVAP